MRHFKHYCKLIFSTLVVVLVFACNSIVSHADPLTGAMIGSGFVSGIGFSGMAGMSAQSASDVLNRGVTYNDPYEWGVLNKNIKIRDSSSSVVDITLNPEISSVGYSRTNEYLTYNNILPHTSFDNGTYYTLIENGYTFFTPVTNTKKVGPVVGAWPAQDDISFSATYSCGTGNFVRIYADGNYLTYVSSLLGTQSNPTYVGSFTRPFALGLTVSSSQYRLTWETYRDNGTYIVFQTQPIPPASVSSLLRSNHVTTSFSGDSVTDPDGLFNKVSIPKSYVDDLDYPSGQFVDSSEFASEVLNIITLAAANGDLISSSYVEDVIPEPVIPDGTLSTTLWDDFKDFFSEQFGDLTDGISSFQESFGDWVDDVASGWTEVFEDIYSTLSGTISSTLSTISSAVQSLVQTIENADFDFVDAFWKNFLTPFNSLFNTIKSHLSIWHYVVEWLASISSVFSFYLGVFSGAGSGFLLPIYACFAGTVVIAVYKRFGK